MGKKRKSQVESNVSNMNATKTVVSKDMDELKKENIDLFNKNYALAKMLSSVKENCKLFEMERYNLQEEYMKVLMEKAKIQNGVKEMTKQLIGSLMRFSDEITNILVNADNDESKSALSLNDNEELPQTSSPDNNGLNKMQAVKPMIGGHVIHRPIINLPRVPTEELARLGERMGVDEVLETIEEPEDDTDSPENSQSLEPIPGPSTRRLEPLQEYSEESLHNSVSGDAASRLLSGIFDVNVYITSSESRRVQRLDRSSKRIFSPNASETSPTNFVTKRKKTRNTAEEIVNEIIANANASRASSNCRNSRSPSNARNSSDTSLEERRETLANQPSTSRAAQLLTSPQTPPSLNYVSTPYNPLNTSLPTFGEESVFLTPKVSKKVIMPVCKVSLTRFSMSSKRPSAKDKAASPVFSPRGLRSSKVKSERRNTITKVSKSPASSKGSSPVQGGRPKRGNRPKSLKEPALNRLQEKVQKSNEATSLKHPRIELIIQKDKEGKLKVQTVTPIKHRILEASPKRFKEYL